MRVITVRSLPTIGRAGNQLFLYVFAKAYARSLGCELQVPDWFGRKIFVNATEPLINVNHLPKTELDSRTEKPIGSWFGKKNIDIYSYCQHQRYVDLYTRKDCREWLTLKPEYEQYGHQFSYPYSAVHLRRGDYVSNPDFQKLYCEVSDESYAQAIKQFDIPQPIYYTYEGKKTGPEELTKQGLDWLPDFLMMRNAAYLLRANSTFSWWAATLGHGKVYSPLVEEKVGKQDCEFVLGNHPTTAGVFKNQSDLFLKES